MEQLKKNAFWVACGAGILVALILQVALVSFGVKDEIAKKKKDLDRTIKQLEKYARIDDKLLTDAKDGLPVDAVVAFQDKRREAIEKELKDVGAKYEKRDQKFEEYFSELRVKEGQVPDQTDFGAQYDKYYGDLKKRHGALVDKTQEFERVFPRAAVTKPEEIPDAQKKFWMMQAVAAAASEVLAPGKAGPEPFKASPLTAIDKVEFGQAKENAAPPYALLPARVEARLRLSDVAKLVSALLGGSKEEVRRVPFQVRAIELKPIPFSFAELATYGVSIGDKAPVRDFPRDVEVGFADTTKDVKLPGDHGVYELDEPRVLCVLELEAVDWGARPPAAGAGR